MPAANTDKVLKVGTPGTATTLAAPGHNIAGTSISVVSTTNWPTDTAVAFAIDQVEIVDGRETRIPGTYTEWVGVVTGPTTIANMVLAYGTDQVYPAGSLTRVYIPVSSTQVNRFAEAFLAQHKQDGTHEDITADSITADTATFDSLTINGTASAEGWSPLGDVPDSVTAKGNGSYELLFNGNDLTDTVTEGMRVRTARTVAAPNTSFSLDGTNDYYVKTSPNKMTWTDDFATGWWIYLTSYALGDIATRYNGTSGWRFGVAATGQLQLYGFNAGSGNQSGVISYQTVPLNKWVHVAAQLDMSAFTATPTTSYIMMNGVDVPAQVTRGGTNPTALVQAGNFEIGSSNGGTNPFPGYIGDGGVFSAKVTQATMLTYMNQALIGTETNLASGYANGSVNDLNTTTPNNLTATNGATTVANSPYGNRGASTTLDYGIVMAKSFSTNTTLTVQVPEGCTIPTSGGVASVDYSTQAVPYGFPRAKGKWSIETINRADNNGAPSTTTYHNLLLRAPVGYWKLGFELRAFVTNSTNSPNGTAGVSTSTGSLTDRDLSAKVETSVGNSSVSTMVSKSKYVELTAVTPYYVVSIGNNTGSSWSLRDATDLTTSTVRLENAYI